MATFNTLQEGKLFSIIWNETDMLVAIDEMDGPSIKSLNEIQDLIPGVSIFLQLIRSLSSSSTAILPGAGGSVAKNCVILEANMVVRPHGNEKLSKGESSFIIDVTMDGVRRQMSRESVQVFPKNYILSVSWENHPVRERSSFQLLIDLEPIENAYSLPEKKKSVPRQLMEKMFADRTQADVIFRFTGNISNFIFFF